MMVPSELILCLFGKAFTLRTLQQHINNGVVDDGPPSLSSFLQIRKVIYGPPSFKVYRVEISLHSLDITTQSRLTQPHSVPLTVHGGVHKMLVSIPTQILERALPKLVQQFKGRVLPVSAQPEPVCILTLCQRDMV
jgi:hypothetical protein